MVLVARGYRGAYSNGGIAQMAWANPEAPLMIVLFGKNTRKADNHDSES
jgi:hypothetical protein